MFPSILEQGLKKGPLHMMIFYFQLAGIIIAFLAEILSLRCIAPSYKCTRSCLLLGTFHKVSDVTHGYII